jgi:hypothetical protein
MSGTGTDETVECPICEVSFDPSAAGGWCTNPDCGEYQYDDAPVDSDASDSDDGAGSDEDGEYRDLLEEATASNADDTGSTAGGEDGTAADSATESEQPPADDGDSTVCPDCGASNAADANFCMECGTSLDDDTTSVPDSLVLAVCDHQIAVGDGDRVGRDVRAALLDAGRPDEDAVRVHREHVRFVREADGFYLVDLGENPTRLNDRLLEKGDREPVGPGDELGFSDVVTGTIRHPENPTG